MSDGIFIGFVEDYEKYQEVNGAKASGTSEDKEVRKIAYDNMDPISDDDLKILQTTITRHDYNVVYMQPLVDFYDKYYHDDPGSYESLLSEVKKIRRIYVNYQDFLKALDLRDAYIDSLVEKYGGDELFETYYRSGLISDWIPPEPQLSKRSKEYKRYVDGDLGIIDGEFNFDGFGELLEAQFESLGIDIYNLAVVGDVVTSPIVRKYLDYSAKQNTAVVSHRSINGVDMSDLSTLGIMYRAWKREELDGAEVYNNVDTSRWFSETPEAIRQRYYSRPVVDMDTKFGEELVDSELDPNEMVVDPELNRVMTRSEYEQREFVRMLRDAGWNELRMMRYLGVGSKYEQKLMFMKYKNRKKAKKKATKLINSIMGDAYDIPFDSTDELKGVLFNDE